MVEEKAETAKTEMLGKKEDKSTREKECVKRILRYFPSYVLNIAQYWLRRSTTCA